MSEFATEEINILLFEGDGYYNNDYPQPDNSLMDEVDDYFLNNGLIESANIPVVLELLRNGIEEGGQTDENLIASFTYSNYILFKFLLYLLINAPEHYTTASRCIALLGNIHDKIWHLFLSSETNPDLASAHLYWVIKLIQILPNRICDIRKAHVQSKNDGGLPGPYAGYDARDQKDFLISGYEDYELQEQSKQDMKETRREQLMIYLLIFTQLFHYPQIALQQSIQAHRDEYQSHKIASTTFIDAVTESGQVSSKHIIHDCILGVEELLILCYDDLSNDAIYQYCFQTIISMNQYFLSPSLQEPWGFLHRDDYHMSTEIVDLLVHMDHNSLQSGKILQGVISIVNENGYPNMTSLELAIASIRTTINILYSTAVDATANEGGQEEESVTVGNFYTNDIKIVVELCIRELVNMPDNDPTYQRLRYLYLDLMEQLIVKSSWSKVGDRYKEEEFMTVVSNILAYHIPLEDDSGNGIVFAMTSLCHQLQSLLSCQ